MIYKNIYNFKDCSIVYKSGINFQISNISKDYITLLDMESSTTIEVTPEMLSFGFTSTDIFIPANI